jgi:hypothetical protein
VYVELASHQIRYCKKPHHKLKKCLRINAYKILAGKACKKDDCEKNRRITLKLILEK